MSLTALKTKLQNRLAQDREKGRGEAWRELVDISNFFEEAMTKKNYSEAHIFGVRFWERLMKLDEGYEGETRISHGINDRDPCELLKFITEFGDALCEIRQR